MDTDVLISPALMKSGAASLPHLRPLALLPASEQRARIVEEDALMRARKPEPEEGENEEKNEEDDPICQTTLKHG